VRIALVAPEIPDYAMEYARTIAGSVDTLLLMPRQHRPEDGWLDGSGLDVEWLDWPRQRELIPSISFMRRLAARVKAWNPDVVHVTMNGHVWTTALMRLFRPLPVISTVHDVQLHPGDGTATRVPNLFFNLGVRQSRAIVVHGETLRAKAMERWSLPPEDCYVLPHVPLRRYKQIANTEGFQHPGDGLFRVLFFGRICEYKGLGYLVRAIHRLEMSGKRVKLVLAGRGDLGPYRQAIASLSSTEVHNHHVSAREAARLFAEADVLALPYIEASQSGVLMMAMAFGLPVVASAVGEISETVLKTKMGLLVPPGDAFRLTSALEHFIEDEGVRHDLAANALRALDTDYSKRVLAARAEAIYEQVCSGADQKSRLAVPRFAPSTSPRP